MKLEQNLTEYQDGSESELALTKSITDLLETTISGNKRLVEVLETLRARGDTPHDNK